MTPPRFSRSLLRAALPADVRDDISGDLDERFHRDAAERLAIDARWRYRRRAAALAARFVFERITERFARMSPLKLSMLDFRLGLRMLWRYPLLSLVSTVSLALAVAIGAIGFAIVSMLLWPSMPIPESDRIVRIQVRDDAANEDESRLTADLLRWRGSARTLPDIGAWWVSTRNITIADGTSEATAIAEVTPSMFAIKGSAPVLGRALTEVDVAIAAPPVMVIGEKFWREKFAADPAIVGRTVVVGETPTTVVGVLPAAFKFPINFEAWQPLKLNDAGAKPRDGRGLDVWAQLAPGATLDAANQEMAVQMQQEARDWPATHAHLSASVQRFAQSFSKFDSDDRLGYGVINLVALLLIAVVTGNVALLMFARAATRESEIVVRSALGAGRARIIGQFCAESFVFSALAFAVGLMLARWAMRYGFDLFVATSNEGRAMAFWYQPTLPTVSIVYAVGIAVFAALLTGVMPGVKVTRGIASRLRQTAPGGGGLALGGVWTILIVAQVALTMAIPVVMYFVRSSQTRIAAMDIGVTKTEYLIANLSRDARTPRARFLQDVRAIREALPGIPGVSHVTIADRLPLFSHRASGVQVDDGAVGPATFDGGYRASVAAVDVDFFEHFAVTPLAGRLFSPADYDGSPRVVIVNQLFVDRVLGGRNPIGRRVKFIAGKDQPWLEIVGMVRDLSMGYPGSQWKEGLYVPLDLAAADAMWITARVPGAASSGLREQAAALRALAAKANPSLRVSDVKSLQGQLEISIDEIGLWVKVLSIVSAWVMLLALSGIYAVMSFSVSRRTREIGIRVALGSSRARVVAAILKAPIRQITVGAVLGTVGGIAFGRLISAASIDLLAFTAYITVVAGACVLVSAVPIRRVVVLDPIEALRND